MLTHFDHVTIAVRDLDAATASYERLLGVPPSWRGQHPELGTEGALFGLSNAIVELVAPRADAPEAEGLRAVLDALGEGLVALAFGTDDAAACSASLRARGLRATAPQEGEAHGVAGDVRRYRTVELSPRSTRGLAVMAVQRDDTARLRGSQPASDACHALDHVVVRTADPEAAIALYGHGLGIRLALDKPLAGKRMLFFRVGGVTLEVVEDASCTSGDALWGVTYRVRDLDAAHARMRASGFALSDPRDGMKPGTRVFGVRDRTCGVPTLVLRDPGRDGA